MKKIKFLSLEIILIIIFILLSSCTRYFDYNDSRDNVSKIEIIKFVYREFVEDAELIKELNDEEIEELLSDLAEIEFKTTIGMELPFLGEYGIKIYDADENYQIICYSGSYQYDNNDVRIPGGKSWRCSKEEFDNLIFKFIDLNL